jgi:hypothetical protein
MHLQILKYWGIHIQENDSQFINNYLLNDSPLECSFLDVTSVVEFNILDVIVLVVKSMVTKKLEI